MATRKPAGYWSNWNNVIIELEPIIKKLGKFPSQKDLYGLNRGDIINGIQGNYGGLNKVRERMGYETSQKPKGYWQNWENFEREMNELIEELNHFPSQVELRRMGRQDLIKGSRHYGSYSELKEKFGYSANQKSVGYWKDFSNVEQELQEAIDNIGHFPTQKNLSELGHSSLSHAIRKYHGGVDKVRAQLGYSKVRIPDRHYKDWKTIESLLRECIDENGDLPSPNKLREEGKEDIVRGVYAYHGGFQEVREKLGLEKSKLVSNDFYEDPDKVREKLEGIVDDLGRMPTTKELKKHSSKFYASICRHFGGLKSYEENYLNIADEQQLEDMLEDYLGGRDE